MRTISLDGETTTSNKGSPYDLTNRACCFGFLVHDNKEEVEYKLADFQREPHGQLVKQITKLIDETDLIIGFNLKFDLTWLRRLGIRTDYKKLWDVQLAEFLLGNQSDPYPSLNSTSEKYGLGQKIDIVKEEYWDKGIDTDEIPPYVLHPYMEQDIRLTYSDYLKQIELLPEKKKRLLSLQNQDLAILMEMEWNGLKYDFEKSKELGNEVLAEIGLIDTKLVGIFNGVPINYGSTDHLSACLFGGFINEDYRIPVGEYKTGPRKGEVKYGWKQRRYDMPRLLDPNPKTEVKDTSQLTDEMLATGKGYRVYSVSEGNLRSYKARGQAKEVIDLILKRAELEKLVGTYYHGLVKKAKESNWEMDYLHGQYNQVVARTGRLSSSNPNQQNFTPEIDKLIVTRF